MFQVTDGHVRKNFAIYLEGKLALTVSVHSELDHLGTAKSAHSTINFGLLGLTKFSLCLRWAEASPCYHLSWDSAADAVIGNVLCNNGASSDDTTVTDINPWHNHRPATKPDVVTYSHGATVFIPLKAHWPFYVTMRMITRVDDHLRPIITSLPMTQGPRISQLIPTPELSPSERSEPNVAPRSILIFLPAFKMNLRETHPRRRFAKRLCWDFGSHFGKVA